MVYTAEGFTNNSPRYTMTQTPVNKSSARKSLCLFTNILDVKNKTAARIVGASKSNRKSIKSVTTLWSLKPKQKLNSKINDQINKSNFIMHHPQVVQSPIFNYCLKVNIYSHTEPQLVTKLLLQVSVQEIFNSLVSVPVDDGLKEARDAENNIIISDSILRSLLTSQLKNVIKIQGNMWF